MALELPLLPETLPEDVEDVTWGLQTAAALWNRGDKSESVVWIRRAADAARGAGQSARAEQLADNAQSLELLLMGPPPSVRPAEEPMRVLPPVAPPPARPVPPAAAEIEDFESLDPEAAEDLFSEEETHDLRPGQGFGEAQPTVSNAASSAGSGATSGPFFPASAPQAAPLPAVIAREPATDIAAPTRTPPVAVAAAAAALDAPASAGTNGDGTRGAGTNGDGTNGDGTSSDGAAVERSAPPASQGPPNTPLPSSPSATGNIAAAAASARAVTIKKRQRAPILDPWSDDMPPSDPPPRTQHHRPELPSDDDEVMTSAPVLDVSLKRKPPPPPPKQRSATLTGGTVLALTDAAAQDSVRPKADPPVSPVPPQVDSAARPPPPPTRKPTTPSMQAVSFPSNAPEGQRPERKSVPPPPPVRSALASTGSNPVAAVVDAPAPSQQVGASQISTPAAPSPAAPMAATPVAAPHMPASAEAPVVEPKSHDVKSEPPPTMPGAHVVAERASRPDEAERQSHGAVAAPAEPPPPPAPAAAPAPAAPFAAPPTAAPPVVLPPVVSPPAVVAATLPAPAAPPRASAPPPAPQRPSAPPAAHPPSTPPPAARPPSVPSPRTTSIPPAARSIAGLALDQVETFSDLSGEIQKLLCETATVVSLGVEEEVAVLGAAVVLEGTAALCPTVADAAAAHLVKASLVPGLSTLQDPTRIRVVATSASSIASWDRAALEASLRSCPWVLEELQRLGDRFSALAGATMGALGDLDEGSRLAAFERLTVRTLMPSEVLVAAGGELGGLNVVGAGAIVVARPDRPLEYSVGDIVLPEMVLEGGTTAGEVRAGPGGALLLSASRMVTVELFSILPSLIELVR